MKVIFLKVSLGFYLETKTKKEWSLRSQYLIHRDNDQPAIIWPNGDRYWFQRGEPHRDNDLPAKIYRYGYMVWYKDGKVIKDSLSEEEDVYC